MSDITVDGITTRYWYLGAAQTRAAELTKASISFTWVFNGNKQI